MEVGDILVGLQSYVCCHSFSIHSQFEKADADLQYVAHKIEREYAEKCKDDVTNRSPSYLFSKQILFEFSNV